MATEMDDGVRALFDQAGEALAAGLDEVTVTLPAPPDMPAGLPDGPVGVVKSLVVTFKARELRAYLSGGWKV